MLSNHTVPYVLLLKIKNDGVKIGIVSRSCGSVQKIKRQDEMDIIAACQMLCCTGNRKERNICCYSWETSEK